MSVGWTGFAPSPRLETLPGVTIRCSCGHKKTLKREELMRLVAVGLKTAQQLEPRLRCSVCEAKEGLDVVPLLRG
jgi:hypothetical protein